MLEHGPIGRALFILSYPAVMGLFSGAVYSLADTFFIGLLEDTAAVGAAGVVFPIFLLISTIGLGFGIGAGSAVSRLLGAKRERDAQLVASTGFYTAAAAGILMSVLGVIFINPILIFFGATETILPLARSYGIIIIGGGVFRVLNMYMNNIIRAEGASSYSGRALMLGSGLNILLDPVFMFLLGLGIRGAGFATITAQCIATAYLLRFFLKGRGLMTLRAKYFSFQAWIYKLVFQIGIPTFIRQSLVGISLALLNQAARPFGDPAIAGVAIVTRFLALISMVNFGIGQGLQPLAGYNYGARNYDRVKSTFRLAVGAATAFSTVMAVLFYALAYHIVFLFSRDPEVISIGARYLRASSLTLWFIGYQIVGSYLFQSLGKGMETALIAMARQGFFFIPLVFILPELFGITGLYFSRPGADFLSTVFTAVLIQRHLKKLNQEEAEYKAVLGGAAHETAQ